MLSHAKHEYADPYVPRDTITACSLEAGRHPQSPTKPPSTLARGNDQIFPLPWIYRCSQVCCALLQLLGPACEGVYGRVHGITKLPGMRGISLLAVLSTAEWIWAPE